MNGVPTKRFALLTTAAALLVAALVAGGCADAGPVPGARVGTGQARNMAMNMLSAYNSGDYTAYTRDFSDNLMRVESESGFSAFRDQLMRGLGRYQSIQSIEALASGDSIRYVFTCGFEQGTGQLNLTLKTDGTKIESVFLQPRGGASTPGG